MNRFLVRVAITVLFLIIAFHADADILDEVKKLPVGVIEGKITVYHAKGYEDRALMLGQMLGEAKEFFEQSLGVSADINLAVLDRSHWLRICRNPYGLLSVYWGSNNLVIMPATTDDGVIVSALLDIGKSGKVPQSILDKIESLSNQTYDEAIRRQVDAIGFHELGHIYTWVYELKTHRNWFEEMAASYFAHAFMDAKYPELLAVGDVIGQIWIDTMVDPRFTSFEAFEMGIGIGVENYAWYQNMFDKRIAAIYPEYGFSFLEKAKAALESDRKLTDEELLARLEEIAPGFIQWAEEVENWSFSVSPQGKLPVTWGDIKRSR